MTVQNFQSRLPPSHKDIGLVTPAYVHDIQHFSYQFPERFVLHISQIYFTLPKQKQKKQQQQLYSEKKKVSIKMGKVCSSMDCNLLRC